MLVQRGQSGARVIPHLILLLLSPLCSGHHGIRAVLVGRVVQESTDVVDKKRVEGLGDPLLVRELERALEWNPVQSPSVLRSGHACSQYSPDAL